MGTRYICSVKPSPLPSAAVEPRERFHGYKRCSYKEGGQLKYLMLTGKTRGLKNKCLSSNYNFFVTYGVITIFYGSTYTSKQHQITYFREKNVVNKF
jgi:hypothetical protein